MPTNSGPDSQAETTTEESIFALRRDSLPNPYLPKARGASRPSAASQSDHPQLDQSRSDQSRSDERSSEATGARGASAAEEGNREAAGEHHIASSHVVDAAHPETRAGEEGKGARVVELPPLPDELPLTDRPAVAMEMGHKAFVQTGYWVSFYRAIFAPDGVVNRLFSTADQRAYFEQTPEFLELHKMMTALRTTDDAKIDAVEPQTMITIRLPRSLQAQLIEEAKEHEVSTNKLCVSKLLLPISPMFVPEEKGKIRGRKPGQQPRPSRLKGRKATRKG